MITSEQIRASFLDFFARRKHTVVRSSSLLPESPNLLFTNAGMNQFVPIFLGEQECPYSPPRVVDTQKCIRAGGKHNDLEDVGFDVYHHTFFEMLGNWSFGDYFKREAIGWAWELLVEEWGFPPGRLYATYYSPSEGEVGEEDEEAKEYWMEKFEGVGLDGKEHVLGFGRRENFWMMGDTGPCGPCSEIHVDLTPAGESRGGLVNAGRAECMEVWNLVFIQFNAREDGSIEALKSRHVDTGMGFERITAIIQCTDGLKDFSRPISNYDTDLFIPLFQEIKRLSGFEYYGRYGRGGVSEEVKRDCAFRVIADHVRALCFAIADGILPGNTDRNYVVRRILRRAMKAGKNLGIQGAFLYRLAPVVSKVMGGVFPEVQEKREMIIEVLRKEEDAFLRTLDKGMLMFEEEVKALVERGVDVLSGDFTFRLYDTYGFPQDLTGLLARERGLKVDWEGFERRMAEQRERARAAQKRETIEVFESEEMPPTKFCGYDSMELEAEVTAVKNEEKRKGFSTNASVFYAEMGGQVGDEGVVEALGKRWLVRDTQRVGRA
ncbi:MAG: alanine--tRNA ligase, partial [Chthoniobacterales bacterium]|nr:alanine--tRNA ligase [Chthoniobacterales bacterium]